VTQTATTTPAGPVPARLPEDRLDIDRLNFAITAVLSHRGITAADLCRETGIPQPEISGLRRHGEKPSARILLELLAWLHMDPALFRLTDAQLAANAA
jgi:hypothetical protein